MKSGHRELDKLPDATCKSTLSGGEGRADMEIFGHMNAPFPRRFLEWRIGVMDAG